MVIFCCVPDLYKVNWFLFMGRGRRHVIILVDGFFFLTFGIKKINQYFNGFSSVNYASYWLIFFLGFYFRRIINSNNMRISMLQKVLVLVLSIRAGFEVEMFHFRYIKWLEWLIIVVYFCVVSHRSPIYFFIELEGSNSGQSSWFLPYFWKHLVLFTITIHLNW